jgi:hypothetical protein
VLSSASDGQHNSKDTITDAIGGKDENERKRGSSGSCGRVFLPWLRS